METAAWVGGVVSSPLEVAAATNLPLPPMLQKVTQTPQLEPSKVQGPKMLLSTLTLNQRRSLERCDSLALNRLVEAEGGAVGSRLPVLATAQGRPSPGPTNTQAGGHSQQPSWVLSNS